MFPNYEYEIIENAIIDRAKQEGLKCKKVKLMLDNTDLYEHIFI